MSIWGTMSYDKYRIPLHIKRKVYKCNYFATESTATESADTESTSAVSIAVESDAFTDLFE